MNGRINELMHKLDPAFACSEKNKKYSYCLFHLDSICENRRPFEVFNPPLDSEVHPGAQGEGSSVVGKRQAGGSASLASPGLASVPWSKSGNLNGF